MLQPRKNVAAVLVEAQRLRKLHVGVVPVGIVAGWDGGLLLLLRPINLKTTNIKH